MLEDCISFKTTSLKAVLLRYRVYFNTGGYNMNIYIHNNAISYIHAKNHMYFVMLQTG